MLSGLTLLLLQAFQVPDRRQPFVSRTALRAVSRFVSLLAVRSVEALGLKMLVRNSALFSWNIR